MPGDVPHEVLRGFEGWLLRKVTRVLVKLHVRRNPMHRQYNWIQPWSSRWVWYCELDDPAKAVVTLRSRWTWFEDWARGVRFEGKGTYEDRETVNFYIEYLEKHGLLVEGIQYLPRSCADRRGPR